MSKQERRAAIRHAACVAAELTDGEQDVGVVHNISATGALLLTRRELSPGDAVDITLVVASEVGPASRRTMRSLVVRSQPRGGANAVLWRYETAVAFAEPLRGLDEELDSIAREQRDSFRGVELSTQGPK